MKRRTRLIFLPLLVSLLLLVGCEFSASTANIRSAALARDPDGNEPTNTFEPDETFYLVVELANAPDSTTVRSVWYAVDVGSAAPPDTLIDEASLTSGSAVLTFNLSPEGQWAPGTYKVELYLNDELNQDLDITVSGDVAQVEPTAAATDEPAATPTTAPAPTEDLATMLERVRSATIRIQAVGSFIDPEFGQMTNTAGQGSGFIIDPSGIAVTNNHVVTGSAFLQVYVEGEQRPRNARILGVSECSDLAVIDIDGDGYPALEWRTADIPVGLEIYVGGFPLFGNEEFTLTRGIVSKARTSGETNWASVDSVIEIDATINPGNSGGPLIDNEGRVVGVNYAASSRTDQYFSISRAEAMPIIEQLRAGTDVNSIGINGQAVTDGESIFGIWVASVKSGSPADRAGVKAGDILTKMEGLVLATDGTMSAYCDILRGRNMTDTMSIEVLRLSDSTLLEGQLNGDRLEVINTFGSGGSSSGGSSSGGSSSGGYSGYTSITDDSGLLQISVPVEWSDVNGASWERDGQVVGQAVSASTDLDAHYNTWNTPGMFFGASASMAQNTEPNGYLDSFDYSNTCSYDGRFEYSDQLYSGLYDMYTNCDGTGSSFIILAVMPPERDAFLVLQAILNDAADDEALQEMLNSFVFLGP